MRTWCACSCRWSQPIRRSTRRCSSLALRLNRLLQARPSSEVAGVNRPARIVFFRLFSTRSDSMNGKLRAAFLVLLVLASASLSIPLHAVRGAGEGEVDIVAWPGYIERGETDKNYDWVTGFEKETGCKVNVQVAATSDEMVTLMNQGGFDLVTASGDASLRLVAGKKVQPINI